MTIQTMMTALAIGGAFTGALSVCFNPKQSAGEFVCGVLSGVFTAGMVLMLVTGA